MQFRRFRRPGFPARRNRPFVPAAGRPMSPERCDEHTDATYRPTIAVDLSIPMAHRLTDTSADSAPPWVE